MEHLHTLLAQLYPSPDRLHSPRKWYLPLCFALFGTFTALPRKQQRLLAVVPLVAAASQFQKVSTGDPGTDFGPGLWLALLLLRYIDISLLGSESRIWRAKAEKEGKTEMLREGSVWERLRKSFGLLVSLRGVGWNIGVKHLKYHQGTKKQVHLPKNLICANTSSEFLVKTAAKCIIIAAANHALKSFRLWVPYVGPSPRLNIFQAAAWKQVLLVLYVPFKVFLDLSSTYCIAAFLCVLLGVSTTDDWPALFGGWKDAYTVGQAWGRSWHQGLRRVCTFPTAPIAAYLGIEDGTSLYRNLNLVVAFTLSGLIHYSGTFNLTFSKLYIEYMKFFWVQAFAIMFEDAVMAVGRRAGVTQSWKTKVVGYGWTFLWFFYSLRAHALKPILGLIELEKLL